jgi:hypothetical protein
MNTTCSQNMSKLVLLQCLTELKLLEETGSGWSLPIRQDTNKTYQNLNVLLLSPLSSWAVLLFSSSSLWFVVAFRHLSKCPQVSLTGNAGRLQLCLAQFLLRCHSAPEMVEACRDMKQHDGHMFSVLLSFLSFQGYKMIYKFIYTIHIVIYI